MVDNRIELVVKYWDCAFPEVVSHLRAPYGTALPFEFDPSAWVRFLLKGLDHYRLAISRRRMVLELAQALVVPHHRSHWWQVFHNEPTLLQEVRAFFELENEEDPTIQSEIAFALRTLDDLTTITPCSAWQWRTVPGHVRLIMRPHGEDFEVEDLVVTTVASTLRTPLRASELYRYSNATQPVDEMLAQRFHRWAELPGDTELQNVTRAILTPIPLPIGDPGAQQGGRSTDLATLVGALCFRYFWSFTHDRVVMTGRIDTFPIAHATIAQLPLQSLCHVSCVEYIPEKLRAFERWIKKHQYDRLKAPCILLLPQGNQNEAEEAMPDALQQWRSKGLVLIHYVETLDQVIDALPIYREKKAIRYDIPTVEWILAAGAFFWWGERLWGGEYLTDTGTRHLHPDAFRYALVSFLPALLPMAVLFRLPLALRQHTALARSLLGGCAQLLVAGVAMLFLQMLFGGLTLPQTTLEHFRQLDGQRKFNIFKDVVVVYPVCTWGLMVALVFSRAAHLARRAREHGLVTSLGFRDKKTWAQMLQRAPAPPPLILATLVFATFIIMATAFTQDAQGLIAARRWGLVAHVTFQLGVGLILGFFVAWAMARPIVGKKERKGS